MMKVKVVELTFKVIWEKDTENSFKMISVD